MPASEDHVQLAWTLAARNGVACMVMVFGLGIGCGWALGIVREHPGYALFGVGVTLSGLFALSLMFWRSRGLMFLPPKTKG